MRLLTINEAAERCRNSRYTIYGWIRSGRLPAVKPGKVFLIRADDLDEFINATSINSPSVGVTLDRLVASWPSLTAEQVERIRELLPPIGEQAA